MSPVDVAALQARVASLSRSVEAARKERDKLRRDHEEVEEYAGDVAKVATAARKAGKEPAEAFEKMKSEGPFTEVLRSNASASASAVGSAAEALQSSASAVKAEAKRLEREAQEADDRLARLEYELAAARRALGSA